MTEQEHRKLVEAKKEGSILIGVHRTFARKLYTDVPLARIAELTGETVYTEKAVVWSSFLGTCLALVASCVFAGLAFRWWALLAIPVIILSWLAHSSMSVRGGARILFITLLLTGVVAVAVLGVIEGLWTNLFLVAFVLSLWLNRLLYQVSTLFLRAFVIRNPRAWNAFERGIVVRPVALRS